jgi:hypothetical protein
LYTPHGVNAVAIVFAGFFLLLLFFVLLLLFDLFFIVVSAVTSLSLQLIALKVTIVEGNK